MSSIQWNCLTLIKTNWLPYSTMDRTTCVCINTGCSFYKALPMRITKELFNLHAHGFLMEKLKERSCTHKHVGFFVFLMEKNRVLSLTESFGLPRKDTMNVLKIKNRRTYYALFEEMRLLRLIEVIEDSDPHNAVRISIMTQDFADYIVSKNEKK